MDINPIFSDIVIIDVASMMDTYLITYIVRAVQKGTRLVIIGDINQLPSVGPRKSIRRLNRIRNVRSCKTK